MIKNNNIDTFSIQSNKKNKGQIQYTNVRQSFERLPQTMFSKDFISYDTALFYLPYYKSIYSVKEFKKEVNDLAQDIEDGLSINIKKIIGDTKVQNIYIIIDDINIITQDANMYELNISNKQSKQYQIETKIKPKNVMKSIKIQNELLIFTIEQNSNFIFMWSIQDCTCKDYIDIRQNVNDIVESEDNIIVCSNHKLFIIRISDQKIRYILDCKDTYLQQLQWDASNNILYTYGKGILTEWDILNKSRQRNMKITNKKDIKNQFLKIDKNQNVLIYYDQLDILIIDLYSFTINREIRIDEEDMQGYVLKNEKVFMFYLQKQKRLGMIFDYNKDPLYIQDFPRDVDQKDDIQLFYSQQYNMDQIIIENNGVIELNMSQNQKPFPLVASNNELNGISCESDTQIFYWQKVNQKNKVKKDDKIQKDQEGIERELDSKYTDLSMRYKDRSQEQEDGHIMMYDKVNKKNKIILNNIGSRVNDLKLCTKDNILYIACKGLYKYDLTNKKLKTIKGIEYNIDVHNIILHKHMDILIYTTAKQVYMLDINNKQNDNDPISLGEVSPKQICLDKKNNQLYCSGNGVYGWCLFQKIQWRITSSKDIYGWDCITIDTINQILYSSNTNKVYHWDLQNRKELGMFINLDQYIIQLEQSESCNYIHIGTKTQIYTVQKDTGIIIDKYNFLGYDFQFTNIQFDFENNITYTILQQEQDNEEYDYSIFYWLSNLSKVTVYESIFLQQFFSNSLTIEQFIDNLKMFYNIYKSSVLLREFFNLYFIAAIHNLPDVIDYIYNQYNLEYPYYNKQNSPLKISLLLNHVKTAQRIVYVMSQQKGQMKMDEEEIKLLLQSKEVTLHDFLPNLFIPVNTYSNNVPLQKLTMLHKYRIVSSQSSKFSPKIYKEITKVRPVLIDKLFHKKQTKSVQVNQQIYNCDSIKKIERKYQNEKYQNPTSFYKFCSEYDFTSGSIHSITFLKSYINSKSKNFVLSQYKYIVQRKWNKYFFYFFLIFILNVLHNTFFSMFLYSGFHHKDDIYLYLIIDIVVIVIIIINELISCFCLGKSYFNDYLNYFDLVSITVSIFVMIFNTIDMTKAQELNIRFYFKQWLGYIKIASLALIYFRTLLYLRIFGVFRYLINMILSLTINSFTTIFIIFYMIISYVIIDLAVFDKFINDNLQEKYLLVYGQMPDQDDWDRLQFIPFVVFSIFLIIILVNFLIAKLSNKYSELESKQTMIYYQSMAIQILEIETMIIVFGKNKKKRKVKWYYIAVVDKYINQDQDEIERLQNKIRTYKDDLNQRIKKVSQIIQKQEESNIELIRKKFAHTLDQIDGFSLQLQGKNNLSKSTTSIIF